MGRKTYIKLDNGKRLYIGSKEGVLVITVVALIGCVVGVWKLVSWPFRVANRRIHRNLELHAQTPKTPKALTPRHESTLRRALRPGFVAAVAGIWVGVWLVIAILGGVIGYSDRVAAWVGAIGAIILPLWGILRVAQVWGPRSGG